MTVTRTCSSCGYTAGYASAPLAHAHHPRHSCDKHRLAADRAARRAACAQTRVSRECTHTGGPLVHGTRAAYVKDRCRCTDCTAANTAASRPANRERTYGRSQPYVDARPVHDHIAALRAAGIGVERIAHLADMALSSVREIADRALTSSTDTRRVRPTTAALILSIDIDDANRGPRSRVDATGTHRRLQALTAIGWAPKLLAAQLGRRPASLNRSMTSPSVTARTARDVAELYERLENPPPPQDTGEQRATANAARAHAARQGWNPPLAWDNIDTDPMPQPTVSTPPPDDVDGMSVERALTGDGIRYDDLTRAEQQEVIHRLTTRGRSIRDIAAQLATTKRTVSRRRASVGP
ncbi:helix-turn-helix domain containing protein [Modestobacter excelsi]|uniref:helix-turn-helix domain containing protein n=1 Tax=Modestobacter excelsi TaxID=2213161 RepID=UPI00110CBB3A|nr:helix-turn-helix domain containing protein [Modestobacter excelsi]